MPITSAGEAYYAIEDYDNAITDYNPSDTPEPPILLMLITIAGRLTMT